MEFLKKSKLLRRIGVVVCFISLLTIISIFEYCKIVEEWSVFP